MENKYFVVIELSRHNYYSASIYKEFDDLESAQLFLSDCETATSDKFDEAKDLQDVLEDEQLFKETFPYFYKKWVESFKGICFEPHFTRDSLYEDAIPRGITDDEYVRAIVFSTIIRGEFISKNGWAKTDEIKDIEKDMAEMNDEERRIERYGKCLKRPILIDLMRIRT